MIINKKTVMFTALALLLKSQVSYAQPITASVIGPNVGNEKDVIVEYRAGYEIDDESPAKNHAFTDRLDIFYNYNTDTELHVFLNRSNPGNAGSEFTNVFFEPKFQLFHRDEDGFDGSISAGVKIAEGDNPPHLLRSVLSGEVPYNQFKFRHNSIIAHEFGPKSDSGLHYQSRWQIMHHIEKYKSNVGVEMFNDFGNLKKINGMNSTSHSLGPVVTGKINDHLGFQTGILAGISDPASDLAGKFWINYHF